MNTIANAGEILADRNAPVNFTQKRIGNFWKKVSKSNSCWNWIGAKDKDGYGKFGFPYLVGFAHRFSWLIHFGSFDKSLCVLHKCDNPACVNPSHLFLGTIKENSDDMIKKGRKFQAVGEQIGTSKLSNREAKEIIGKIKDGVPDQVIAIEYNVGRRQISKIRNGRAWSHI